MIHKSKTPNEWISIRSIFKNQEDGSHGYRSPTKSTYLSRFVLIFGQKKQHQTLTSSILQQSQEVEQYLQIDWE